MDQTLWCDCGAVVTPTETSGNVRCPQCGALLAYHDVEEEPAPTRKRTKSRAARNATESTPATAAPAEVVTPAGYDLTGQPSAFVPYDESATPGKKRKRRKSTLPAVEQPADDRDAWWLAWFDPTLLLWLPVLVPVLALAAGSMILTFSMIAFSKGGQEIWIGGPAFFFSSFLFAVPAAYLLSHFSQVLAAWSLGQRHDPNWPGFDPWDSALAVGRWAACLASSTLVLVPLLWLPDVGSGNAVRGMIQLAVGAVAGTYFLVTLLAVTLWEDVKACSPTVVLPALWRLGVRLVPFALEVAVHLSALVAVLLFMQRMWNNDFAAGALLWLCWWMLALLSLSRLMRSAGMLYRACAGRVGWF